MNYEPLEAVIFDWAGTLVDFGSVAPIQVLIDAFGELGVPVTADEARPFMGMSKRDHIAAMGRLATVIEKWERQYHREMTDLDVDEIYRRFMPLQLATVTQYSQPIAGAAKLLAHLHESGLRTGSCSGYPRIVMDKLLTAAAAYGITPQQVVAGDDLQAGGRPGPWMALQNVIALGASSVKLCVKVDDTIAGIEEGLNAGMWTVGVVISGNQVGLTFAEWQQLSPSEQQSRRELGMQRLIAAGAHEIVDTVADLPSALAHIAERVRLGEEP